jgi:hypothetical protein
MFFWKRKVYKGLVKKKEEMEKNSTIGKFKIGDFVHFRYREELYFGYVEYIYKVGNDTLYNIQVGGQCPAVIKGINEETIFILEK